MTLSMDDIQAIATLVEQQLEPRFDRIDERFDETLTHLDGLYKRDEAREHEYLALRQQLRRLEDRVDVLECSKR